MISNTQAEAGAKAMANELAQVLPADVATAVAHNMAQALVDDTDRGPRGELLARAWPLLEDQLDRHGQHLQATPRGVDPLDVYLRVGVVWLEAVYGPLDSEGLLAALLFGHGYKPEHVRRVMAMRREAA